MIPHIFINKSFENFKTNEYAILDKTPYKPEVLILGTFNKGTDNNNAHFFYGRKNNYFWYIMRNIFNDEKLEGTNKKPTDISIILNICKKLKLSFSDFILSTSNKINGNTDRELENAVRNNQVVFNTDHIIDFLSKNKSIKTIYFTRNPVNVWGNEWNKLKTHFQDKKFIPLFSPSPFTRKKLNDLTTLWEKDFKILDEMKKFSSVVNKNSENPLGH